MILILLSKIFVGKPPNRLLWNKRFHVQKLA